MTPAADLPSVLDALRRFYGALPEPPDDAFGLYVWLALSFRTPPQRREAAVGALRQLRALTPDSLARAARGPLEAAVAHAGPLREERLRALTAGAAAFRRHRDLDRALKGPLPEARAALEQLPQLADADGEWLLLFAGDHPVLPADPHILRVLTRLGHDAPSDATHPDPTFNPTCARAAQELEYDIRLLRRATIYLSHHGRTTCTEGDPHCGVCPLLSGCREGKARQH